MTMEEDRRIRVLTKKDEAEEKKRMMPPLQWQITVPTAENSKSSQVMEIHRKDREHDSKFPNPRPRKKRRISVVLFALHGS